MSITLFFLLIICIALILILLTPLLFVIYTICDSYCKLYYNLFGVRILKFNKWLSFPALLFFNRDYKFIMKNKEYLSHRPHTAIVIANNYFPENYVAFGISNIIRLVNYLVKNKKPYKVYDYVTRQNLKKIIGDKNVKSIVLFGHGQRHGIRIGRNEMFYYCELNNPSKKHLVAQFHCNHFKGKGLADYMVSKPLFNFVKDKKQNDLDLSRQITKIIKNHLL